MRYVALFSGASPKDARFICATADPEAVAAVARAALRNLSKKPYRDAALQHLVTGRRQALEEVIREKV
jgi:7-keto-8-aminopelargonate synthetase-like enzyme